MSVCAVYNICLCCALPFLSPTPTQQTFSKVFLCSLILDLLLFWWDFFLSLWLNITCALEQHPLALFISHHCGLPPATRIGSSSRPWLKVWSRPITPPSICKTFHCLTDWDQPTAHLISWSSHPGPPHLGLIQQTKRGYVQYEIFWGTDTITYHSPLVSQYYLVAIYFLFLFA